MQQTIKAFFAIYYKLFTFSDSQMRPACQADLDIVVETCQRFNEHVATFVGKLIATRREEVQRLVEIKVKMSAITTLPMYCSSESCVYSHVY